MAEIKKITVKINTSEDVHLLISRNSKRAIDLQELVYSHILLPVRSHFGREAKFAWSNPQDWIKFCNGETIQISVKTTLLPYPLESSTLVEVHHGTDRVVYVKAVDEVAAK